MQDKKKVMKNLTLESGFPKAPKRTSYVFSKKVHLIDETFIAKKNPRSSNFEDLFLKARLETTATISIDREISGV